MSNAEDEGGLIAARYASALVEIIAALGPDHICKCELPPDCELRDEAEEALRVAKDVLNWRTRPHMTEPGGHH